MDKYADHVTQGIINTYKALERRGINMEKQENMEEIEAEETKVKKENKQKYSNQLCTLCGEKVPHYTKDGKTICSSCKEFPANLSEQFFHIKLGEIADIKVKGFHPSPLPSDDGMSV